MNRRTWLVALSTVAAVSISGCALDPSKVPIPGASVSGPTYRVRIEFANALNLPSGAKVMANGAQVGSLRTVTIVQPSASAPGHVDADVEIKDSVKLPTTTVAQLRQNTILGDIFIGLTTPPNGFAHTLADGDVIPMGQTKPALQVEDLMSGISTFVTGGALHQVQSIVDRTNAVMPENSTETARIFGLLGHDVEDVASNLDTADAFLNAAKTDVDAAYGNRDLLVKLLTDSGARELTADARSLILTLGIVGGLGVIAKAIKWLAPLASAGDAAARVLVPLLFAADPLDLKAPSNLNRLVALIRDKIIPFAQHPKVNIAHVGTESEASAVSTDDQVNRIIATLRMIGMVR